MLQVIRIYVPTGFKQYPTVKSYINREISVGVPKQFPTKDGIQILSL